MAPTFCSDGTIFFWVGLLTRSFSWHPFLLDSFLLASPVLEILFSWHFVFTIVPNLDIIPFRWIVFLLPTLRFPFIDLWIVISHSLDLFFRPLAFLLIRMFPFHWHLWNPLNLDLTPHYLILFLYFRPQWVAGYPRIPTVQPKVPTDTVVQPHSSALFSSMPCFVHFSVFFVSLVSTCLYSSSRLFRLHTPLFPSLLYFLPFFNMFLLLSLLCLYSFPLLLQSAFFDFSVARKFQF